MMFMQRCFQIVLISFLVCGQVSFSASLWALAPQSSSGLSYTLAIDQAAGFFERRQFIGSPQWDKFSILHCLSMDTGVLDDRVLDRLYRFLEKFGYLIVDHKTEKYRMISPETTLQSLQKNYEQSKEADWPEFEPFKNAVHRLMGLVGERYPDDFGEQSIGGLIQIFKDSGIFWKGQTLENLDLTVWADKVLFIALQFVRDYQQRRALVKGLTISPKVKDLEKKLLAQWQNRQKSRELFGHLKQVLDENPKGNIDKVLAERLVGVEFTYMHERRGVRFVRVVDPKNFPSYKIDSEEHLQVLVDIVLHYINSLKSKRGTPQEAFHFSIGVDRDKVNTGTTIGALLAMIDMHRVDRFWELLWQTNAKLNETDIRRFIMALYAYRAYYSGDQEIQFDRYAARGSVDIILDQKRKTVSSGRSTWESLEQIAREEKADQNTNQRVQELLKEGKEGITFSQIKPTVKGVVNPLAPRVDTFTVGRDSGFWIADDHHIATLAHLVNNYFLEKPLKTRNALGDAFHIAVGDSYPTRGIGLAALMSRLQSQEVLEKFLLMFYQNSSEELEVKDKQLLRLLQVLEWAWPKGHGEGSQVPWIQLREQNKKQNRQRYAQRIQQKADWVYQFVIGKDQSAEIVSKSMISIWEQLEKLPNQASFLDFEELGLKAEIERLSQKMSELTSEGWQQFLEGYLFDSEDTTEQYGFLSKSPKNVWHTMENQSLRDEALLVMAHLSVLTHMLLKIKIHQYQSVLSGEQKNQNQAEIGSELWSLAKKVHAYTSFYALPAYLRSKILDNQVVQEELTVSSDVAEAMGLVSSQKEYGQLGDVRALQTMYDDLLSYLDDQVKHNKELRRSPAEWLGMLSNLQELADNLNHKSQSVDEDRLRQTREEIFLLIAHERFSLPDLKLSTSNSFVQQWAEQDSDQRMTWIQKQVQESVLTFESSSSVFANGQEILLQGDQPEVRANVWQILDILWKELSKSSADLSENFSIISRFIVAMNPEQCSKIVQEQITLRSRSGENIKPLEWKGAWELLEMLRSLHGYPEDFAWSLQNQIVQNLYAKFWEQQVSQVLDDVVRESQNITGEAVNRVLRDNLALLPKKFSDNRSERLSKGGDPRFESELKKFPQIFTTSQLKRLGARVVSLETADFSYAPILENVSPQFCQNILILFKRYTEGFKFKKAFRDPLGRKFLLASGWDVAESLFMNGATLANLIGLLPKNVLEQSLKTASQQKMSMHIYDRSEGHERLETLAEAVKGSVDEEPALWSLSRSQELELLRVWSIAHKKPLNPFHFEFNLPEASALQDEVFAMYGLTRGAVARAA